MNKILMYSLCILLGMPTVMGNTEPRSPNITAPIRYIKPPLRFKTYGSYLQYVSIKVLKGVDSANAFYKKEFETAAYNYTDYLPLTGGTLTGTLVGTDASFSGNALSVSGNNPALNISSSNAALYSYLNLSAGSASNQIFTLGQSYNSNGYLAAGAMVLIGATTGVNISATDASGVIRLYTGGANERVKIDNNGNVGIGTTSPGYKLDVNGTGNFSGNALSVSGNNPALNITSPNATLYSYLNLSAGSASNQIFTLGQSYNSSGHLAAGAMVLIGATAGVNIAATDASGVIKLYTGGANERMRVDNNGNVGIGITSPSEKLSVNGNIKTKKLIVTQTGWSDYVFAKNYKLRSLQSLEAFINQYKHLPEVPTAKEVETKGVSVGDNQALLLKKIEELTLYVIDQQKQINELKKQTLNK